MSSLRLCGTLLLGVVLLAPPAFAQIDLIDANN